MGLTWVRAIPGALKLVPREVWYALALAITIGLARGWYNGKIKAAELRGEERAYAAVEKKAKAIEARAKELTGKITTELKDKHDAEVDRISRDANDLRLSGPGKAICYSAQPAGASRRQQPSAGTGNAALPTLPYPRGSELLAMPFDDAVAFAEQHDLNLAEVKTWREWYRQQSVAWSKLQAEAARPTK